MLGESRSILNYSFLTLQVEYSNSDDGQYAVSENKVWGFLHFSKNFSSNLATRFNEGGDITDNNIFDLGSIQAWIDNTSKNVKFIFIIINCCLLLSKWIVMMQLRDCKLYCRYHK